MTYCGTEILNPVIIWLELPVWRRDSVLNLVKLIAVTQREYDGRNVSCRPAPFLVHANLPQVLYNSEAAALYQSQIRRESNLEHRSGPILSFHRLAG